MVPLKPPSTDRRADDDLAGIGDVLTRHPSPPPSPAVGATAVTATGSRVVTTGKRETSPLHVQPETAVIAAATMSRGNARRVIEAVSTRGGTGPRARRAHAQRGQSRNHRAASPVGQHSSASGGGHSRGTPTLQAPPAFPLPRNPARCHAGPTAARRWPRGAACGAPCRAGRASSPPRAPAGRWRRGRPVCGRPPRWPRSPRRRSPPRRGAASAAARYVVIIRSQLARSVLRHLGEAVARQVGEAHRAAPLARAPAPRRRS